MPRATNESKRCKHIRKDKTQCKRWATHGSEFCKGHANAAGELTRFKTGTANVNYKHGRYSKALPERMRQDAEAALNDPELLNQRSEIALLTARLSEQLQQVDSRTSGKLWSELQAAAADFRQANAMNDREKASFAMSEMLRLINAGGADHAAWEDIRSTVLDKNKLIASERKRLVEMQAFVTAEQGMVMIGRLAYAAREALDKHVPDAKQRGRVMNAIALEMKRYTKPAAETDEIG
jgi:hypothetical protein